MAVRWDEDAKSDLQNILDFYTQLADEDVARRILSVIRAEIRHLAVTPLLQRKSEISEEYQVWLVYRSQYRVYYRRLGPRTIYVYRIWPSRRLPLDFNETV